VPGTECHLCDWTYAWKTLLDTPTVLSDGKCPIIIDAYGSDSAQVSLQGIHAGSPRAQKPMSHAVNKLCYPCAWCVPNVMAQPGAPLSRDQRPKRPPSKYWSALRAPQARIRWLSHASISPRANIFTRDSIYKGYQGNGKEGASGLLVSRIISLQNGGREQYTPHYHRRSHTAA
jgi:hypothetical protein